MKKFIGIFSFLLIFVLFFTINFNLKTSKSELISGVDYIEEEVVALADSKEQAEQIAEIYGVELKSYDYGVAVFSTNDPKKLVKLSEKKQGELPSLSLNMIYHTLEIDNQESFGILNTSIEQWHHAEMDTERAWDVTKGEGALVAVIDTGIATNHPAFEGHISELSYNSQTMNVGLQYVEDDRGHGTHVAGIIAGNDDINDNYGVAPNVEILMIKANEKNTGSFYTDSLLRAINYATENGADVINMSLGRSYTSGSDANERMAIQNAVTSGVTIVCAAGNDNKRTGYPAAYPETIAVSATKENYAFETRYSSFGPEIDVAAPGTDIFSADYSNDGYVTMSGTSMASPNVAGTVALIKSLHPEYTPNKIKEVLHLTAQEAGELERDDYYGYGIVSAYASVLEESSLIDVTYENIDVNNLGKTHTIKVAPGSKLIIPISPIGFGAVFFGGWFSDEEYVERFNFLNTIDEETTIYGSWLDFEDPEYSDGLPYYAEFPDPVFREFVLKITKKIDTDLFTAEDKEILANYSSNCGVYRQLCFTSAYIDTSKLIDLTGINYFSNTTRLAVNDSQIEKLDITGLVKLNNLVVISNYNLTSLNVSNLLLLETITARENALHSLDVSSNISLGRLDVRYNGMESTENVVGWQNIGLIEDDTFLFNSQTPIINITYQPSSRTMQNIGEINAYIYINTEIIGARGLDYDLQYQWYVNDINSKTGGVPIEGEYTRFFNFPTTLTEGPYYYYCEITALLGETVIARTTSNVATLILYPTDPSPSRVTFDKDIGGDVIITIASGSFNLSKVALNFGIRDLTEGVHYTVDGNQYTFKESMLATLPNISGLIVFSFTQGDLSSPIHVPITVTGVGEGSLDSISVTTNPTKTTYTVGETFDPTGMVITANYTAGKASKAVTNYSFIYYYMGEDKFNHTGSQIVNIIYTEGLWTVATQVNVNVIEVTFDTEYTIDDNYLKDVKDKTTIANFESHFTLGTGATIEVYDANDDKVTSGYVGTGMTLVITINSIITTYDIIVKGDTDGDGEVTAGDAYDIILHSIGRKMLEGAYLEAAKINSSDEVTAGDAYDVILYSIGRKLIW